MRSSRVSKRPGYQNWVDKGSDNDRSQEKTSDTRKNPRKIQLRGKDIIFLRLRQLLIREAPETDTTFPWGVQFAKQLAAINKQLFENGFEEIIQ